MSHTWYEALGRFNDGAGIDLHYGANHYLEDTTAAAVPPGWLRPLTDAEIAALPPAYYRVTSQWRNGKVMLRDGTRYRLDRVFAEHVMRDSAGVLVPLSPSEIETLRHALAYASAAAGSDVEAPGPEPDVLNATRGQTGTGPAMSTATMWGGVG